MYTPSEIVQFSFFFLTNPDCASGQGLWEGVKLHEVTFWPFYVSWMCKLFKKKLHLQFSVEVFLHKNEWK